MNKTTTMTNTICTNCERETDFKRVIKEEPFVVKGEQYNVKIEYSKCKKCGDEVLDPNLGTDPFVLAYREYRKAHGLLQSEEIKDWRKSLRLTQAEVSKLLGIGIVTQ